MQIPGWGPAYYLGSASLDGVERIQTGEEGACEKLPKGGEFCIGSINQDRADSSTHRSGGASPRIYWPVSEEKLEFSFSDRRCLRNKAKCRNCRCGCDEQMRWGSRKIKNNAVDTNDGSSVVRERCVRMGKDNKVRQRKREHRFVKAQQEQKQQLKRVTLRRRREERYRRLACRELYINKIENKKSKQSREVQILPKTIIQQTRVK